MKKVLSTTLLLGMLANFAYANGNGNGNGGQGQEANNTQIDSYVLNLPKQDLSEAEKNGLIHMREDEKLARDVYLTLYNKWHLSVFQNISKAEKQHMHLVKVLLDKYNISDPVEEAGDEIGVFKDSDVKNLYKKLVTKGEQSEEDALIVGATVEDLDIYDLDNKIKETDNEDIKYVYQKLRNGSYNHMRAFIGQLKNNGWNYTPQYISEQEFNQILNSKNVNKGAEDYKTSFCIYLSSLPKGWNMVGSAEEVNLSDINVNYENIWIYKNGKWQGYAKDKNIQELIKNKYGLIETVKPYEGFWIKIK